MQGSLSRLRVFPAILVIAALLGPILPPAPHVHADAAWLTGWSFRQAISVDNAGMTEMLANFPLYVPLAADGAGDGIAAKVQDTGYDIRFTSANGTNLLPYERESYSEASGDVIANFWVGTTLNADDDAATDDTIYLYYGNASAADGQDTDNGTNDVWDDSYTGVWHMKESGTNPTINDSTSNAYNSTSQTWTPTTNGKIGAAASLDGSTNSISMGNIPALNFERTDSFSGEAWVKANTLYNVVPQILGKIRYDSPYTGWNLDINESKLRTALVNSTTTQNYISVNGTTTLTNNTWHHLVVTYDGSSGANGVRLYVNGALESMTSTKDSLSSSIQQTSDFQIGSRDGVHNVLNGFIDDIRISSIVRSSAWIAFEYANTNDADSQLSFATEESALEGWLYRKEITISPDNVDATLTDFPLLVKVSQDTDLGTGAQNDGEDIRFTLSDGETLLPYEREDWRVSSGSGSGHFWVKVPSISDTADTTIYLFYGNADAGDGEDAASVWGASSNLIWHLPDGSTLNAEDSLGNNNGSVNAATATTGQINGGAMLNGSNAYITSDANVGITGSNARTVSMSINVAQYGNVTDSMPIAYWGNGADNQLFLLGILNANQGSKFSVFGYNADLHGTTEIVTNTWYRIAITVDGASRKLFVNGNAAGFDTTQPATADSQFNLGRYLLSPGWGNGYFNGSIDEVRISSVARSAAWIKFEYYNMNAASNELTWSLEQDAATGLSASTVVLVSSDTTTSYGEAVTLTATVTPSTATGTVTFKNGSTTLGTAQLGHGSGSIMVSNLAAGTHSLSAEYGGNADFASSTSAAVAQTIQGLDSWLYRKKITVDHANVDAALTDFPLLVNINQDADLGAEGQSDGADFRFISSTGMLLTFEKEDYRVSSGSGSGNFWVKVPSISDTADTTIYLYYGNAAAGDGEDAANVWDNDYEGVWHLNETAADEGTLDNLHQDSTGNNNEGDQKGNTGTTGKIGNGQQFDGSNDYISIADSTSWDFGTGMFSVSMWFKKIGDGRGDLFSKKSSDAFDDFGLILEDTEIMDVYLKVDNAGDMVVSNGSSFSINTWHYAALVRDGSSNLTTYIDDAANGSGTSGSNMNNNSADIWFGSNHDNFMASSMAFNGLLDEVRISSVARTAAWTKFEYHNMGEADNELAWSAEQDTATGLSDSSVVLTSSDTTTTEGETVTLTATVTPSTATGTITFKNGATTIATATIGHGSGSITVSDLAAGTHSLTAEYGGSHLFTTSTSDAVTQTVSAAAASSSSSTSSSSEAQVTGGGGGGGGGRRGSNEGMQNRIRDAQTDIFARYQSMLARQEESSSSSSSETTVVRETTRGGSGHLLSSSVSSRNKSSAPVIARNRNYLVAVVDEASILFKDVPLDSWFTPYVSYVIEEKIAQGYRDETGKPKGEFGVGKQVTYAEMLKMALEAANADLKGIPPPRNASALNTWASPYVAKAEAMRLSVFSPTLDINKPATRGAVIQTLLEVLGFPVAKQPASFTDVPVDHPHGSAIATAAFYGLVEGDKDASGNLLNRFRPEDPINRAEVAKIIALSKEILRK